MTCCWAFLQRSWWFFPFTHTASALTDPRAASSESKNTHHNDVKLTPSCLESTFSSLTSCLLNFFNVMKLLYLRDFLPYCPSFASWYTQCIIKIIGPFSLMFFFPFWNHPSYSENFIKRLLALFLLLYHLTACAVPNYRYSAITVKFTSARLQLNWFSAHF